MNTKFEKIGAFIFCCLIITLFTILLFSFKSPEPMLLPANMTKISTLPAFPDGIYKLTDGMQTYIIVMNGDNVAITSAN